MTAWTREVEQRAVAEIPPERDQSLTSPEACSGYNNANLPTLNAMSITYPAPYALPLSQQLAILVFSAFYFVHWFTGPLEAREWAVQLAAFALFLVTYFVGFNIRRFTLFCAITMVALAFLVAPINYGANTFAIYASSFFAYYQPPRRALIFIGLTLLTLLASTLIYQLHLVFYFGISAVMIFGLGFSGMIDRQRFEHQRKEQQSQSEIRRLAKIAERERISQDLHDVIGHSLTGIHLQAQLALKHLESNDVAEAKEQCQSVAALAHNALKEIRATLADINKQSLAEELAAQQVFLHSVGIHFEYQLPETPIPMGLDSDLVLIARELITNTLRHSHGNAAHLRVSDTKNSYHLHYYDNGKGLNDLAERHYGNGLQGVRRRVLQRRGELKLYNNSGLHIHLTLPWDGAS